jgi:hypothetical protein
VRTKLQQEMQRHRMGMISNFLLNPLVNLVWGWSEGGQF